MDSLTHGLLGLALGAVLGPLAGPADGTGTRFERARDTRRGLLLASVIAAELPDLDYLWPASDDVVHALRAHRGVSHSLLLAPVVALVAAVLARLVFRRAEIGRMLLAALLSVVCAHLLADAWTGWGTRLLLPFSEARVALDWMLVIDPLFTLPLLAGALLGSFRRRALRKALTIGLAVSVGYLGLRIGVQQSLTGSVRAAYPAAGSVQVFPSWFGPLSWRYVAVLEREHAAGAVRWLADPVEQARWARESEARLSAAARASRTVQEALAWARFPVLNESARSSGGSRVRVADLRYHLNGAPTLTFQIELDAEGRVSDARLDRGGSATSLLERLRGGR